MTIREELEGLVDRATGLLFAKTVVEWARLNPQSELHKRFEWDNEVAGNAYRLDQARKLISLYYVEEDTRQTIVFSLVSDQRAGGGYRDKEQILSTSAFYREAIGQGIDELERWLRRFQYLGPRDPRFQHVLDTIEGLIAGWRNPPPPPPRPPGPPPRGHGGGRGGRGRGQRPGAPPPT